MAEERQLLTKADYARHRGVSGAMVSHWTNRGRIWIVDGKVDVAKSDAMLAETLDPARGGKRPNTRHSNAKAAAEAMHVGSPSAVVGSPGATDTYTRVRTFRESFRAKTEEMEYRQKIGELVERSQYDKALADGLGPILAALDSLGPRLGPVLAAETDPRRIQNMVDDAIAVIRQDMADTLRQMVVRPQGTRQ